MGNKPITAEHLCEGVVLQDNGPLVQLMRWLWDENAHGIYLRDFSQIHAAENSQLEACNWPFIRTPQHCTGLLERTLQETWNKSETERKCWDCLLEARKKKHLILKGGVQRKWRNPTSKRQVLENKTYTKKIPIHLKITHLSNFTIVEPKSEPNIDTMSCSGSDAPQHENGSAENLM